MSSLSQVERAPTNDDGARRACARRNFVSLYYAVMRARDYFGRCVAACVVKHEFRRARFERRRCAGYERERRNRRD